MGEILPDTAERTQSPGGHLGSAALGPLAGSSSADYPVFVLAHEQLDPAAWQSRQDLYPEDLFMVD